jgi:hypothetical protein
MPQGDGRPAELALIAAMQVSDFDFDLLVGRRGSATAALLAGWQSDAVYFFVMLAPHKPVALWSVSTSPPDPSLANPVATCSGVVLEDAELPDSGLAHLHLTWRDGTLTVSAQRTLLSCRPPVPLPRGQVGVGSIDGTAVFGNLSLSR